MPEPVDIGEDYGRLVEFAKDQPEYQPLVARLNGYDVFTFWEFSDEERAAVAAGKNLCLRIMTFGQTLQPVFLAVEDTEMWRYVRE